MKTMLQTKGLCKSFPAKKTMFGKPTAFVHAVHPFDLVVNEGETLGIVGESGCGKTTLARMLVGLLPPSTGSIELDGLTANQSDAAAFGKIIQYVFQDPVSSLNPRKTIRQIMQAPLKALHNLDGEALEARILELFAAVNLRPEFLHRYPHEFSGGQAQRIGIARALAANAKILILDEPVSALDVSVQAQVLNLLAELKTQLGLTYVFISHDLAVVEAVSDRVVVLYFGSIVEVGPAENVFAAPKHPYTHLLAASAPMVGKPLTPPEAKDTELPDPLNPPTGCPFHTRCPYAQEKCMKEKPGLNRDDDHQVACHFPLSE